MLKKYQYIFIAIFLGSMLFTVFQYLPILEEEVHASKTMSKKADNSSTENDSSDDDSSDDENDTDEFFKHNTYHNLQLYPSNSKFNNFHEKCLSLAFSINTPPPKI